MLRIVSKGSSKNSCIYILIHQVKLLYSLRTLTLFLLLKIFVGNRLKLNRLKVEFTLYSSTRDSF